MQEPEFSCEDIASVPAELRCAFVAGSCPPEGRIPYARIYYCSVEPHGPWAIALFAAAMLLLLLLLFSILGDTAELYFSPTMALVSQVGLLTAPTSKASAIQSL